MVDQTPQVQVEDDDIYDSDRGASNGGGLESILSSGQAGGSIAGSFIGGGEGSSIGNFTGAGRYYGSLKMTMGAPVIGKGAAFDQNFAASVLQQNCNETTGYCQRSVADALEAGGFTVRDALDKQGGGHDAKDMAPLLKKDPRFAQVGGGSGAQMGPWNYQAQKGDIAVWEGGPYGHIQMCVGQRPDGSPIWQSDFTAREENWTGLRDPDSHGAFTIFRQKVLDPNHTAEIKAVEASKHQPAGANVTTAKPRMPVA